MTGDRAAVLTRFIRYATVGLVSNGALYVAYLGLTALGVTPEPASALLYCAGIAGTYLANRGWSFKSERSHAWAAPRYAVTYLLGMGAQIATLAAGHRVLDLPHQVAQLGAMVAAAAAIFLLLNLWVFAASRPNATGQD